MNRSSTRLGSCSGQREAVAAAGLQKAVAMAEEEEEEEEE
jgi:hypothetical protein